MKFRHLCFLVVIAGTNFACTKTDSDSTSEPPVPPVNQVTPSYINVSISTDKAVYNPGDEVIFTLDNSTLPATAKVRYKHLNNILSEAAVAGSTWKWITPSTDFTGYMAEVYSNDNGTETIYSTIGIDVSSSWKKFPRYGFLSRFPLSNDDEIDAVISNLNRYHINGLQFYDWHNKHHKPLPLIGSTPPNTWKNISNSDVYFNTRRNTSVVPTASI